VLPALGSASQAFGVIRGEGAASAQADHRAQRRRRDCGAARLQANANKLRRRAHGPRAFFATAAIYDGKGAPWITDRTGHTSLGMPRTCARDVRRWREFVESLVDVAEAIPEFATTSAAAEVAAPLAKRALPIAAAIEKCTGRDSNPYASRRRNLKPGEGAASNAIPQDSAASVSESARDDARSRGVLPRSATAWKPDSVEAALARALTEASAAGRFDVVLQLAKELEARWLAPLTSVLPEDLDSHGGCEVTQ